MVLGSQQIIQKSSRYKSTVQRAFKLHNERNCHHQHVGDIIKHETGTSLVAQWLRLHSANAGGMGSIPSQGTVIPTCYMAWPKKKFMKILPFFAVCFTSSLHNLFRICHQQQQHT